MLVEEVRVPGAQGEPGFGLQPEHGVPGLRDHRHQVGHHIGLLSQIAYDGQQDGRGRQPLLTVDDVGLGGAAVIDEHQGAEEVGVRRRRVTALPQGRRGVAGPVRSATRRGAGGPGSPDGERPVVVRGRAGIRGHFGRDLVLALTTTRRLEGLRSARGASRAQRSVAGAAGRGPVPGSASEARSSAATESATPSASVTTASVSPAPHEPPNRRNPRRPTARRPNARTPRRARRAPRGCPP